MVNKPVYETCYKKEQCVTQKQFVETHYKDELYTVTEPVTKFDCITVDEGCYVQVWVPKLVTKQIPRTEYVHKTACRQVPYQVTKCVPEVTTKMVPYQRVRYVQCPSTCISGVTLGTSCGPSLSNPTCGVPNGAAYGPAPHPAQNRPMPPQGNVPSPGDVPLGNPQTEETIPMPREPVPRAGSSEGAGNYFPSGPALMGPEQSVNHPAELGRQITPERDPNMGPLSRGSNVRPVPEPYAPRAGSAPKFRPSAAATWNSSTQSGYSGTTN